MPQLLNLSRAARLAGVSRSALQQKIRDNELPTFEGKIQVTDLLRVYPQTRLEDNTMLEKVAHIKAIASPKSVQEREFGTLPSQEVLAGRITALGRELAESRVRAAFRADLLRQASEQLRAALALPDAGLRAETARLADWLAQRLEQADLPEANKQLLARDALMRVMAAHVKLLPSGHEFLVDGASSLLDAALAAGLSLNYGCASGHCGKCKARVVSGQAWKTRPHEYMLSEAEQDMGYVLACSHTALTDLVLEAAEASHAGDLPFQEIPTARCESIEYPAPDVAVLSLRTPRTQSLRFMAGQYVRLMLEDGATSDCYLASCPCDGQHLQFHLARAEDAFSRAVFAGLPRHAPVSISGPDGDFVLREGTGPVLLVAYNEGFGPIKSLMEQAIAMDLIEAFHLYWLAPPTGTHYAGNLCRAWRDALENFQYTLLRPASEAEALQRIVADHPNLADFQVYLAGPRLFIEQAEAWLCRHGLPATQLHRGALPPGGRTG